MNEAIIIFIKNPVKGKTKTRLAAEVGEEKALEIYLQLLAHTRSVTSELAADKLLFYDSFIAEHDEWDSVTFQKHLQTGNDLGERMQNAFDTAFKLGYKKVVIIGSDCVELRTDIIDEAFDLLDKNDLVIGPAKDGGYYLLGKKLLYTDLFKNKEWSTDNILSKTLKDIKATGKSYSLLPILSDIDTYQDMIDSNFEF